MFPLIKQQMQIIDLCISVIIEHQSHAHEHIDRFVYICIYL